MTIVEIYLLITNVILLAALAVAVVVGLIDARDADRSHEIDLRRRTRIRHRQHRERELRAELELTAEACDRLAARNEELRDQVDLLTCARADPTAVEEMTAWLGTLHTTHDREYPL